MIIHTRPRFCPICGDSLQERFVLDEERDRLVCDSCGHIHYINPKIVAGTIPAHGDKIWLLRRAIEPRYGAWTFPAGFMEMNETVEQAAARETMEELNLTVDVGPLLGVYSYESGATVHIVYVATPRSEPSAGKEALEFGLFTAAEIPWDELAFLSTRDALADWVRTIR